MIIAIIILVIVCIVALFIYLFIERNNVGSGGDGYEEDFSTKKISLAELYVYKPKGDNTAYKGAGNGPCIGKVDIYANDLEKTSGFTVGRSSSCDLSIANIANKKKDLLSLLGIKKYNFNAVGSIHFLIAKDDKGVFIQDCDSKNGIGLVGDPTHMKIIDVTKHDTWFWIADVVMKLVVPDLPDNTDNVVLSKSVNKDEVKEKIENIVARRD